MSQKRGKKPKIDRDLLTEVLLKYKNQIILPDFRIISKSHSIWIEISKKIEGKKLPIALYTYVSCDKYGYVPH